MPLPSALEQVQRESRARLYPSLRNPNWLILRRRRQIFEAGLGRLPGSSLCVLDIGGRLQPYRPLLGTRTRSYVAVDLQMAPLINVGAAAEALPFRDAQFDFVICTQVFEYLPDPGLAVAGIKKGVRQGGGVFFVVASGVFMGEDKKLLRFFPAGRPRPPRGVVTIVGMTLG